MCSWIKPFSELSTIIISVFTLYLGYYTLVAQRKKDQRDKKVQWIKDLIIVPNYAMINERFFDRIRLILEDKVLNKKDISEEDRLHVIETIKTAGNNLRRGFILPIQQCHSTLGQSLKTIIDNTVDNLTETIDKDQLKLYSQTVFEQHIEKVIDERYAEFIGIISTFEG